MVQAWRWIPKQVLCNGLERSSIFLLFDAFIGSFARCWQHTWPPGVWRPRLWDCMQAPSTWLPSSASCLHFAICRPSDTVAPRHFQPLQPPCGCSQKSSGARLLHWRLSSDAQRGRAHRTEHANPVRMLNSRDKGTLLFHTLAQDHCKRDASSRTCGKCSTSLASRVGVCMFVWDFSVSAH